MAIYQLGHRTPAIDPTAYVHEQATVIGAVRLGAHVSIWPHATLRGDNEAIVLGAGSNVQESCVLHTDPGFALTIGDNVTIGHQAMLHGCTVGDGTLIGIQAVLLNGAVIGKNCLVGACALVAEGAVIPDNSVVIGVPGRVTRSLSEAELNRLREGSAAYVRRSALYVTDLRRID
jgi:carbonic anhydrase/acetyltransferase-like protein (isoleucine patch superfamily)